MTMRKAMTAVGVGAIVAAGLIASPALFAQQNRMIQPVKRSFPTGLAGVGSFTPASGDPRLAAALARSGLNTSGFRFTPSEGRTIGNRAVSIASRSRSVQGAGGERIAAIALPAPTVAPITYSLGGEAAAKRSAIAGNLGKLDAGTGTIGGELIGGIGPSIARLRNGRERNGDRTHLIGESGERIDAGSYSLTRNLDVTAGMRNRTDKERLVRLDPNRREPQAVYVGTSLRF